MLYAIIYIGNLSTWDSKYTISSNMHINIPSSFGKPFNCLLSTLSVSTIANKYYIMNIVICVYISFIIINLQHSCAGGLQ